jgi:thymidylate synthase ThyX
MAFEAAVLADSITERGHRLTTIQVTLPRFVLAEFNTHRAISRNSASSRAIPLKQQIKRVQSDPAMPVYWGRNKSGMQATEELQGKDRRRAVREWLAGRDRAVKTARKLGGLDFKSQAMAKLALGLQYVIGKERAAKFAPKPLDLHKQVAARVLEPYMWQTIIASATDLDNFFALRDNPEAQPEFRHAAHMMRLALEASTPRLLGEGEWHMPLVQPDEAREARRKPGYWLKVCIGRCARVSYLTHDGKRNPDKDVELHDRLLESGHMSPFEHAARPMTDAEYAESQYSGNFRGWHQYRKDIANEDNFALARANGS